MARLLFLFVVLVALAACEPEPLPEPGGLAIATALPTVDQDDPEALCHTVVVNWTLDWPVVIAALERLDVLGEVACGSLQIRPRLYDAYIAHGTRLEQQGYRMEAVEAYQTALDYNFTGREAVERLRRLQVFTPEPPPTCDESVIADVIALIPPYEPLPGAFVRVRDGRLSLDGTPFPVYGINYYPRDYPFERFLTRMNADALDVELRLMRASGINTLRVYLDHDDLFICPGSGAIPIPANLERLDRLIQQAGEQGFKLILVLNQNADLTTYPLYTAPEHTMQQMAYLAARYRDEPAVMAYDLRDNGQMDYSGDTAPFSREEVLAWLAQAAAIVRQNAPRQLITAGWGDDAAATAPLVDVVSFQHFGDVEALRQEIAVLTDATTRPLLLAATGYETFSMDEISQRQAYERTLESVARTGLAGWVIWTAFDYPPAVTCVEPNCPGRDSVLNHYGLWTATYFPKLAVQAIEQVTGAIAPATPSPDDASSNDEG